MKKNDPSRWHQCRKCYGLVDRLDIHVVSSENGKQVYFHSGCASEPHVTCEVCACRVAKYDSVRLFDGYRRIYLHQACYMACQQGVAYGSLGEPIEPLTYAKAGLL